MTADIENDVLPRFALPHGPSGSPERCTSGGLSGAEVWRISTLSGDFALRAWPPETPSADRPEWIARQLRGASYAGCRTVPVPLPTSVDPRRTCVQVASRWWQCEPWTPGEADYLQVSSEGKLRNAFTALAAMHAALRTGGARECRVGPSPAIAKRRVVWQELVGGGWEAVRNAVAAHGSPDEKETAGEFERHFRTLAPAVEHLLHLSERPSIRLQPTAGDLHAEHVLFVGEQVGGFIDFGAMAVDSVALDVARLVGSMAGDDPVMRRIALDAYRASSSSSGGLSVEEEVLVDVLDRTGILLATYRWLRWVCVERRTFSNRGLVAIRRRALMLRLRKMAETM